MLVVEGREVFTTLEELMNPRYTALLLIDVQNDYVAPNGYFDGLGWASALREAVPRMRRVLEAARNSGVLVVHVQMTSSRDFRTDSAASLHGRLLRHGIESVDRLTPFCVEGTWGWRIVDELAPLPDEVVIKKHRSSGFFGTNLDLVLRSNSIKSVAVAGLVTQGCVMATANDALFYGYCPVLLRDCVVSHKPALHDAALLIMSEGKDVATSEEVLAVWRRGTTAAR